MSEEIAMSAYKKAKTADGKADANAATIASLTQQIENHKNIYFSEVEPTSEDGADGDLWFVFAPLISGTPSLSFNGTSSYVSIPSDEAISGFTDFTCEFWVTIGEVGRRQGFVTKHDSDGNGSYIINMRETNDYHTLISPDGTALVIRGTANNVFSLGNTYHLAISHTSSAIKLYINGQLQSIVATAEDPTVIFDNSTVPLLFGKFAYDETRYFKGVLKDVRIWNTERTQAQIQTYMNVELDGDEEGLAGYWKLNEGEGTIAYDSTSNENHGTIYNCTWTEA